MFRHTGSYDQLGDKFEQLWNWVTNSGVPAKRTIGIYWDNPDFTPTNRLRSAACVEVPIGTELENHGPLPIELSEIAGGNYATTTFVGSYDKLAPVWTQFTAQIEGALNRTITQNPAFEVYVNDASETPPEKLITELYTPVL